MTFLQWSLPRMGYRWRGFRKVHRTVCKRLSRRLRELDLADLDAYRAILVASPEERRRFDALCRIPISRFARDRALFDALAIDLLPALAREARGAGRSTVAAWSAGCASGEEPYSLGIVWRLAVAPLAPDVSLDVIATDIDATMLARARTACYPLGSLRDLRPAWRRTAFEQRDGDECLRTPFRSGITFRRQDIREMMPPGPFNLILCRNLAFTYFDSDLEARILRGLHHRLAPDGVLIIGMHETPPKLDDAPLERVAPTLPCYRRARGAGMSAPGLRHQPTEGSGGALAPERQPGIGTAPGRSGAPALCRAGSRPGVAHQNALDHNPISREPPSRLLLP